MIIIPIITITTPIIMIINPIIMIITPIIMIITPVHRRPGESSGMAVVHRTGYWGSPTFCCHFIIMTTLTIIIIIVIILIIIISIDVIIIIIIIIRLLWLYYHHPIISIYHQCHHQTGPGSWLSPRSSLWHIINDQSINDWQYYCWANELWLSSSLPILVLSSLFSFSWAELRPLSSSCLKRWCVLPSRSLRTFALPDNQPLWKIHLTTLTNTYNLFDKYILTTSSNTCHNFDKYI